MENPFLLAVALLESRKITTRLLASARENEPAFGVERDEPIDWSLLVVACGAAGEPLKGHRSRSASHLSSIVRLTQTTEEARRAPQKEAGEGGRTRCLERVTGGSCA
jgi:hypothetical protein